MPQKQYNHKSWCYTLNNYTEQDIEQFKAFTCNKHRCAKEVGENDTQHLQGTITFKRSYTLKALKKLNEKTHWEPAKTKDAENYCTKGEIIIDISNNDQGKRTDIDKSYEYATQNKTLKEFLTEKPNYQAIKVFEIAKSELQQERNFKPTVLWIYGPTGTGKTKGVVENEPDLWISGKNLKWWQGYENQEATLFDDFRGDFCTYHELLRILDRYPYTVEVKGGSRKLNSKRMYVTSCKPPWEIYTNMNENIDQLLRRIDKVVHLTHEQNIISKWNGKEMETVVEMLMEKTEPELNRSRVGNTELDFFLSNHS